MTRPIPALAKTQPDSVKALAERGQNIKKAAAFTLVLLVACTGEASDTTEQSATDTTTSTSVAPTTTPDLSGDLELALEQVDDLEARVSELQTEVEQEAQTRKEAESALAEAEAALEEAQSEVAALRLAYDDEIQQILSDGVSAVVDSSCSAIDGVLTDSQVTELIDRQIADWVGQPGLPEGADEHLDRQAIEEQVATCVAEGAEEARQAELREAKSDGFWTVGEEIAPGTWESQGSGDGCYWARLDSEQGIIDNHFGNAGGRITIRSSDAEVEFNGCGQWEYQG